VARTTHNGRAAAAAERRDATVAVVPDHARSARRRSQGRDTRWLAFSPPPRALLLAGWALLPLRAFLGFTFLFAGLQKLANPNFFNASNPAGIQAQLIAAQRFSPLHPILGHLLHLATPLGIGIAVGEVAVGLGTLLGLWTRAAAAGGALISLSLFLTVTWQVSPYYTGADLAYIMAWLPLIVAGSGGVLSLDAVIAAKARHDLHEPGPETVPIAFSAVQQVCGQYEEGYCKARGGEECRSHGCPFLVQHRQSDAEVPVVQRRRLVLGGAAVAAAGVVGAVVIGTAAGVGRAVGGAKALPPGERTLTTTGGGSGSTSSGGTGGSTGGTGGSTSSGGGSASGHKLGPASQVPVGNAASFTDPSSGDPGIVLHLTQDNFVAYDAVCPHAGCTVGYSSAAQILVCPCHGSEFNPTDGGVVQGPASRGLNSIPVKVTDGELYVDT
jgi:thiosulfate dehydrogenase [quinone] large subunit